MKKLYKFRYDADTGELYKIWIVTVILSILTLGIYRFWGKTRIRRYTTSGFSLNKDRFEYTGHGAELFWGFVKAVIFLTIISIPFIWSAMEMQKLEELQASQEQLQTESGSAPIPPPTIGDFSSQLQDQTIPQEPQTEKYNVEPIDESKLALVFTIYFSYLVFFFAFLPFVAKFQALRYRAARLNWRGIRGHLTGSALAYGFLGLLHIVLLLFTSFLWKPFMDLFLLRFKLTKLQFGDQQGDFKNVPYFSLFLTFLGMIGLSIVLILFLSVFFGIAAAVMVPQDVNIENFMTEMPEDTMSAMVAGGVFAFYAMFFIVFSYIACIYRAARNRIMYNHFTIGGIRFKTKMTGNQLFGFHFVNALIIIFTLGLGYPLVMQRRHRFFVKHINIIADFETAEIMQAKGIKYKTGEGLIAFLDLKLRLF